jgi:hypothetical protein
MQYLPWRMAQGLNNPDSPSTEATFHVSTPIEQPVDLWIDA